VLLEALAERLQGRDWVLKGGTNLRLYFGSNEHAVSPANDSAVREYLRPDDPPLLLPSYTRPAAIRQKINALASRAHVQARDVFDLFVLGAGTLRGIDTGFLRRWLDEATLRNARGRALEISHAEYSDTRFWRTWTQRNANSCSTRTPGSRVNCLSAISSTRS
jgi:hypothetical protein